nr:Eco57I restriction-modification methylase domain-containing protein [Helicobacter pullorum]
MFSPENINCRALHECILYYLRERDENLLTPNTSLTYIIITDFYQFYIFKSSEFKRLFESKQIKNLYKNFTEKKGLFHTSKSTKNEDLYAELKKILSSVGFLDSVRDSSKQPNNSPHTNPLNANPPQANPSHTNLSQENPPQANIEGYYFDLRTFDSLKPKDKAHIATLLSPEFLHDERTLDPNAISEPFYRELLHILGLTEKEQRKIAIDESQENSFAKHIFYKLEQKIPKDSLLDSMMNLIIIWLNRILFLKLIESKLLEFNDNDTKLCFLTSHKIKDFATLEHLFFEVLAKNYDERQNVIDRGFHYLPYLNSSLFSKDEIETRLLSIGTLDSSLQIAYYSHTILQDREGKAKTGKTTFLAYLFDFLNSYAFGLESSKRDSANTDSTNIDSRIDTQSHSTNPQTTESTIYKAQSHADSQTNMYHTHTSHYTSKTIIKSSVLGSVFERLNGYKEGSFYTPSFITNYMCKEAIDKAVVEKFNTQYDFRATNLAELQEDIKDSIRSQKDKTQKESIRQEFKKTLLSLTLCDPSVGSGHFLVSALNYLVFIHWYLKLALQGYEENSKQHSYDIEDLQIIDDEIILLDSSYSSISYTRPKALNKTHRIQKELFTLKKEIIESCLFGVDINPISCHIAQLRLWIELLKSTYYTDIESNSAMQGKLDSATHRLETLPNIDINIKEGNSLLSYIDTKSTIDTFLENMEKREMQAKEQQDMFAMQELESFKQDTQKKFYDDYKKAKENSNEYKNAKGKEASLYKQNYENYTKRLIGLFKRNCDWYIDFYQALKDFFYQYGYINLTQLEPEIRFQIESYVEYFNFHKNINFERKNKREIDSKKLQALLKYLKTYEDAQNLSTFEWRFAFPEVLDSSGDFMGFDIIIGNPPYIRQEAIKELKPHLQKAFSIYKGTSDIYTYFFELGHNLLRENGILSFITSNKYTRAGYGEALRAFLLQKTQLLFYMDFNGVKVFDSATVDTAITSFVKAQGTQPHSFIHYRFIHFDKGKSIEENIATQNTIADTIPQSACKEDQAFPPDMKTQSLKRKIESIGTPLKDWDISINYGIKTGYNEAFIIDSNKREEILGACDDTGASVDSNGLNERERTEVLIKPILRGRDIKRYSYEWAGLWVIFIPWHFPNVENPKTMQENEQDLAKLYPAIYQHLLQHKDNLSKRNKAETGIRYEWYCLQRWAANYYEEFAKPKIVWNPVSGEYFFTYLKEHMYFNNSLFMITQQDSHQGFAQSNNSVRSTLESVVGGLGGVRGDKGSDFAIQAPLSPLQKENADSTLLYILGLMNSTLYKWLVTQMTNLVQTGQYAYGAKDKIEKLPIPKITESNQTLCDEIMALVDRILKVKAKDSTIDTSKLESKIDKLVYKLYNLTNEEINMIDIQAML